ncbi:hypothetical protein VOLCADRAFT_118652 [Volvox carteri f. nagariensis]|uniref:Leucine-rich repeat-containing N-terminal plant-type domain-containing protein n=1 Tax=Volvox carteri f. nagariensis TaxID=3068 RepID=D8U6F5_VOLCA|nr:uncharacterized protein VOLCADRAFT_118652 [Volvox carteri f. nagariensis]EFJ44637.1 hypothetical protein VOLCADRAFT_118652 [Volvox carteri f. nagariensis]|eukprot:XP_002954213.1 hypothetical protein VOLCADRAFT_118652 [Volvox carteri f. nagariensis]
MFKLHPRKCPELGCVAALLHLALLLSPLSCRTQDIDSCSEGMQKKALISLYEASGGPSWVNNELWTIDAHCVRSPGLRPGVPDNVVVPDITLPPFCCWAGVDCCLSESYIANYTACGQYQCNCTVGKVTGLNLGRNGLKGRLQDVLNATVLTGLACSLRMAFLGGNELTGKIPQEISQLRDIRILGFSTNALTGSIPSSLEDLNQLEELDLSNNQLTGSVPSKLCGGTERPSNLRDLVLSNNNLTGRLVLPDCEALINLDVQNNFLSGPILDISSYRQLHILRLGNNQFNGTVNFDMFDLRLLVLLDLALNK